ncbi:MAG: hypothetical protein LBT32_06235 [Peptococcaceae bacterium]|jgi:rhamnogalacturonyl hydrolase YesR|nr:hypothetical protein [Peptococcaceae bacterium]
MIRRKKYLVLILGVVFLGAGLLARWIAPSVSISVAEPRRMTYQDGVAAANWAYEGLALMSDAATGAPQARYSLSEQVLHRYSYDPPPDENSDPLVADFWVGLAPLSAYLATGDEKFLTAARHTADLLEDVLPETGLVPLYDFSTQVCIEEGRIMTGTNGQASILEYVSYLARIDADYRPLLGKLADGLCRYALQPETDLAWFQIQPATGAPVYSASFGFETQLGSQSVSCAQALLAAYNTDPDQERWLKTALRILQAIWQLRDPDTNLLAEVYDLEHQQPGTRLYPYQDFRYDDMGGVYLRGLTMAYQITGDPEIRAIAEPYMSALLQGTWDTGINGGAFRYLNTTHGEPAARLVETMHGLFIATLLKANDVFYAGANQEIIRACTAHAQHTIVDGFGLRNGMVPHQLGRDGRVVNASSDSQLAYAVLQFPLGYERLSQITENPAFRQASNQILSILLERHKIEAGQGQVPGYVNIVETQPPYGFEHDYARPEYLWQAFFLPAYLLYNSLHPSAEVTIGWDQDEAPGVFGLVCDMPYWNERQVFWQDGALHLAWVSGSGSLDMRDIGLRIREVTMDQQGYADYTEDVVHTQPGRHTYEIWFAD